MKEAYTAPEMEIVLLDRTDVIVTSNGGDVNEGEQVPFPTTQTP